MQGANGGGDELLLKCTSGSLFRPRLNEVGPEGFLSTSQAFSSWGKN
jgi:hypothetical protein